jgi:hypothetical protein
MGSTVLIAMLHARHAKIQVMTVRVAKRGSFFIRINAGKSAQMIIMVCHRLGSAFQVASTVSMETSVF